MNIKLLEATDNIQDYIDCVKDLNSHYANLSSIEDIKYVLEHRPSNILTFVMVNDSDRIVSTATVIMEKKLRYQNLCMHIEDVGTHPHFRNLGYGSELIRYCVKIAEENKCYKVKLNCEKDLVSFYEKLDFKVGGNHMGRSL